ncbi:GNAT family N-acetyltransferase [Alteromonas sp. CyTr2]|uniref:GNAT family N-acetyltransferase n=1 Tax=Alteromonas sp. CyTr2 TaxID=2935039 RepID=UPI00248E3315|nr:GNAT family N-acetyltransferase [Alteromonas sp. CyTr2]
METASIFSPSSVDCLVEKVSNIFNESDPSSFFLDKQWITSWLSILDELPDIYIFKNDDEIIGFALLSRKKALTFPPLYEGFLNQKGQSHFDQVWIEYNGIICRKEKIYECISALLTAFFKNKRNQRLTVSMTTDFECWQNAISEAGYISENTEVLGYKSDLTLWLNELEKFEFISKNTHSQLKRSINTIEKNLGKISFSFASKDNILNYFFELGALHKKRWNDSEEGSGFDNQFFVQHHVNFLTRNSQNIDLVKVSAGKETLGYVYNIKFEKTVYFYCSGLNYDITHKHIKPGYTIHHELMKHYRKLGYLWYDFLGGYARYKDSLSSAKYQFKTLTIYRSSRQLKLTRIAKKLISFLTL